MALAQKEMLEMDVRQLQQQAEDGDVDAQMNLANRLRRGLGIKRNVEEAIRWLQKAADQQCPEAMYQLGRCAEDGNGMPQSDQMAAEYYHDAAELGYADAQYAYGMCLLGGIGCSVDMGEAEKWFDSAARQGHPNAQQELEHLKEEKKNQGPVKEEPVATVAFSQNEERFAPIDPTPYKLQDKNLNVKETPTIQAQPEEPLPPVQRSAKLFIAVFAICGIVCGLAMKPIYQSMPNASDIAFDTAFQILMPFVGGLIGAGIALALSGVYRKIREAFPLYGVLLLLPFLIFITAGIIITVVMTIVKIVVVIIGIIVGICALGYFFGG